MTNLLELAICKLGEPPNEQMDSFLALHLVALDSIRGISDNFSIEVAEIY